MPSRAMPKPIAARSYVHACRSERRPEHWVLCYARTYRSGRPRPRASAKATCTLSTQGDWEGTPPSQLRVAVSAHVLDCRGGYPQ